MEPKQRTECFARLMNTFNDGGSNSSLMQTLEQFMSKEEISYLLKDIEMVNENNKQKIEEIEIKI